MPLAAVLNGTDFLLQVNTGPEATPVWATVGAQRGCKVKRSRDMLNVSSKDSMAKRVKSGEYSYTISLDYLYVPAAAEMLLLRSAIRAGTLVMLREFISDVAGSVYKGLLDGHEQDFPHQGESTVSVSFMGDDFETVV